MTANIPNPLFVSRQAELIFCLTQLDGKLRCDILGITESHYGNVTEANEWLKPLCDELINGPLDYSEALEQLYRMHSVMINV